MLEFADPFYRKYLRLEFQSLYFLDVDRLISQNQPWEALIEAEQWKRLALTWLQNPNADPQPLTRETLQTAIGQLCPNPQTAILYWHLSPAQITIFLLRPHQDPQIITPIPTDPPFTPTTQTTENFTEWLKHYKTTYNQTRKTSSEKVPLPKGDLGGSQWRDELPPLLAPLPNLLNIPQILEHLPTIETLILIPHRDLHLLPLHALFNSSNVPLAKGDLGGFRITYRPNLTQPIPTHSPNPDPTLLIIKNPQSTIATGTLPWAETEVDSLSTLYTSTIIKRPNAHLAHITPHLTQPHHQFHFAGHGNSDPDNPLKSCLYLNNKDTLTVETLLTLNLPAYDLVSLSACETALTNTGEFINEFVGLPSAFLKSGAKQVLSSQWSVESFPTTLTMIEFHRRYRAGMPAAQALAEVQIWLRNLTREDLQTWLQTAQTLIDGQKIQSGE
ncbi:CHAT domain-containing protein [Spirulina major]|uniref:CHAT domain-containing protein n=1 Tax=Spirulina major TaxID=270636 RepID=UPI001FE72CD0|nr:CHAT domain-containing protein [Spirulina major]